MKSKEEITKAIHNYRIIIDQANALDSSYKCENTQNLLYAIFNCCIPNLETELQSIKIHESHKREVRDLIEALNTFKKATISKDISVDANTSHESPIVHLLCLAVEKQAISYSREHRSEAKN